jgi:DNA-binding MarR family transcriptional regulator
VTDAATIAEKHDGALGDRSSLRLWLRLLSCATTIEKLVQRRLGARFATTLPRFDVLAALERRPEGMTMSEVSRALLVSNGNVTAIVQSLLRDGHVVTDPHPTDRRSSVVRITPVGLQEFRQMAQAHHGWIDEIFSGLAPHERDALYAALGQLKAAVGEATRKDDR